jgi:hypothetical protein
MLTAGATGTAFADGASTTTAPTPEPFSFLGWNATPMGGVENFGCSGTGATTLTAGTAAPPTFMHPTTVTCAQTTVM